MQVEGRQILTMMIKINRMFSFLFVVIMVLLCSHNCNGLRNVNNFQNFVSVLYERHINFTMLQETFWDRDLIDGIQHMYEGVIYDSNGQNCRQGVAILVSNSYKDKTKLVFKDNEGRFVHVSYENDNIVYNLISLYAPNNYLERSRFFKFVKNYISKFENLIIGGDYNTTLSSLDRSDSSRHVQDEAYRELCDMISSCNIYDVWRSRNENSRIFSWKRITNGVLQQSRLDYFLISRELSSSVQNVYYNDTSFSDHNYVIMNFSLCNVEKGPGLWILNNTLLNDDNYIMKVKNIVTEAFNDPLFESEILIWWDNLKYKIKMFSKVYSKDKAKEKRSDFFHLQNKIQRLCALQAEGVNIDIIKLENLKMELSCFELEKCKGAVLRSKAIWATEGDKNTKFFLNLEKYKQENNAVKELINEHGDMVNDTDGILDMEYNFYKKLYSCVDVDKKCMNDFIDAVDITIDDGSKELCDAEITFDEIAGALKSMSKNKSPGSDGLTTEFYCKFYDILKDVLFKVYNSIFNEGMLTRSMRAGVLSLIYKKKGDRCVLKNYRPISLLQVDYKILARIMANRFKQVLPSIISENQTCCIIGRDISNTIANVRDVITLVENDNLEGYIVKIDQEKAFDRVSHDYMLNVLKKFGFGDIFINWITIFYNKINSSVKCNGFLTKYFNIENGIRQGCPISALLYVLAAEPLRFNIQNCNISGIKIPNSTEEALIFQHADDTTLTVSDKCSVDEVFKVFNCYEKSSGAKINRQKSEILPIGTGCISDCEKKRFGLQICDNYILLLGVFIGKDQNTCDSLNWHDKVVKIKRLLNMWCQRKLTIQGRVNVISSLLMSRLWYALFVSSMPHTYLTEMKTACINFIWNNGAHLVKYNTIINQKSDGGLQVPDIMSKMYAFRLKFLIRYLDQDCKCLWKSILNYFISQIYGMKLCQEVVFMSLPDRALINIPVIYREMFRALDYIREDVHFNLSVENIYDQPLFCNPNILYCQKCILWHDFIQAGIVQVKDICYEFKEGFLNDNAIVEMIRDVYSECNSVDVRKRYNILKSVLPDEWCHVVLTEIHHRKNNRFIDANISVKSKLLDFKSCTTKQLYFITSHKICQKPTSYERWIEKLDILEDDLRKVWSNVNYFWKPSCMMELDFKVAHCCIFTNSKLLKIGLLDNSLCDLCKTEDETIVHLFITCEELMEFHEYINGKIIVLFENCDSDRMNTVDYEEILLFGCFGKYKGVNTDFLNFMLSVARYCIFRRRNLVKLAQSNVDVIRLFKYTLRHYVSYYYEYLCILKDMQSIFEKKFIMHNPIVKQSDEILIFEL